MAEPPANSMTLGLSSLIVFFINKETQAKVAEYKRLNLKGKYKVIDAYFPGSTPPQECDDDTFVFKIVNETSINIFVDYLVRKSAAT